MNNYEQKIFSVGFWMGWMWGFFYGLLASLVLALFFYGTK
jgi:hypothetical protein